MTLVMPNRKRFVTGRDFSRADRKRFVIGHDFSHADARFIPDIPSGL